MSVIKLQLKNLSKNLPFETFQFSKGAISDILQLQNIPEKFLQLETFQFLSGFIFVINSHPSNIPWKVSAFEVSQFSNALIFDNFLQFLNIFEKSDKVEVEGKGQIELNEFYNIADAFAHNGDCTRDGGIRLNNVKYFMINFDNEKKVMYLKRQGGGAVIALSNMSYVIGTFNTEKMMTKDNVQENQNNGYCAKVVEELAQLLISMNY